MRIALVLLLSLWAWPVTAQEKPPVPAPDPPALTETQQAQKAAYLASLENATLRAKLADALARVQALETVFRLQVEGAFKQESEALSKRCTALETAFRAQLKVAPERAFDCGTLEFK